MARTDAIVLGAGIVGTSAALHLAKRGVAVALVDRRAPGEETSVGNAGGIEGTRNRRIRREDGLHFAGKVYTALALAEMERTDTGPIAR